MNYLNYSGIVDFMEQTKRALAEALKKTVEEKPIEKITVSDIVEKCNVTRQTFYYHFENIYSLIIWIYKTELSSALAAKNSNTTWQENSLHVFKQLKENKKFFMATYNSFWKRDIMNLLFSEIYKEMFSLVESSANMEKISESEKRFIANFYKYAFAGVYFDWIEEGMVENPDDIVSRIDMLITGDIARAVETFAKSK